MLFYAAAVPVVHCVHLTRRISVGFHGGLDSLVRSVESTAMLVQFNRLISIPNENENWMLLLVDAQHPTDYIKPRLSSFCEN